MKAPFISTWLLLAALTAGQLGSKIRPFGNKNIPLPPPENGDFGITHARLAPSTVAGTAFFDQLLDHKDPSKGTFKQQYWWNATTWAGPNSPVVFFTPGEVAAAAYTGYLVNRTITGLFAQEIKGATTMLEHRYYGASSPYDTLTVENLQLLTIEQAIEDVIYFAKTVDFAFDTDHSSNADNAPWVFSGGSYSGALSAYTESVHPGVFWAYHASSAPVEALHDFWQYFVPIQAGMPKNCSRDVTLVIDYVDDVLKKGTAAEKLALKKTFGLEAVEHDGDFGNVLQGGPWNWQSIGPYTGYSGFDEFCDTVENAALNSTTIPDANGVGLEKALAGYAAWTKPSDGGKDVCTYYGYDEYDWGCYNSYDPKNAFYTDLRVDNVAQRQWEWILCNEPLGFWQDGAPRSQDTLISRFVSAEYWQRQCDLYFPTEKGMYTYRSKLDPDNNEHKENKWTQGWRLEDTTRLIWTNGEYDPWKSGSVSAEARPGGPLATTPEHPVNVIPKGIHCYDLITKNGLADPGTQHVIDVEVKQIVEWVAEYYQK